MAGRAVKLPGVALIVVFGLGVLWGKANTANTTSCIVSDNPAGTVVRVQERAPSSAQYRVRTDNACTLLVTTSRFPEYQNGDVVHITGEVQRLSEFDQKYAGYADYLNRQGIDGTVRFAELRLQSSASKSVFTSIATGLRRQFERTLAEPEASVVVAMTLGDRGMIPEDIRELFQRTGLAHILAISGLHLSIIAGLLIGVSRLLPLNSRIRAVLVITVLWSYVVLVSSPISAQRAAIFWTLLLLAFELRALVSLPTVLILAASVLVSLNPQIVFDVGFQLSFAAVAGIGLALFLARASRQRKGLWMAVSVPVGAAAATWPIVSYHFGLVSLVTVGVNILAMPAVPIMVMFSLAAAGAGLVTPTLGIGFGLVVHSLWQWVESLATFGASLPGATFDYTIPLWLLWLWYGIAIVLVHSFVRYQKRNWYELWS